MVVAARALHPPLLLIHALLHEDSGDRRRDGANRKRVYVCVGQRYGRRWVAGCILVGCRFWSVSEPSHSPKSGSYSILRKYWLPRSSLPTSSPLVNRSASLCWAFPSLCVSLAPEPNHFDRLMMTHQTATPRWLTQQTAHLPLGGCSEICEK